MKKKYLKPEIVESNMNLSNQIAGCWHYSGSENEGGCDNLADFGDPRLCIAGWTEGTPSLGAS